MKIHLFYNFVIQVKSKKKNKKLSKVKELYQNISLHSNLAYISTNIYQESILNFGQTLFTKFDNKKKR